MLAAAQELHNVLPGIYIDAQVSRQMAAGLAEVSSLAAEGLLRHVVIVGLGTNGPVTSGQIRDLLAEIGPSRKLVLVNTYEARPWEHADNSVIGGAARRYSNVVLANWHATIVHRTSLLWGDGVHPRPSGARLYAKMLAAAVQTTASARPAGQSRAAASPPAGPGPTPGGPGGQSPAPGSSAGRAGQRPARLAPCPPSRVSRSAGAARRAARPPVSSPQVTCLPAASPPVTSLRRERPPQRCRTSRHATSSSR